MRIIELRLMAYGPFTAENLDLSCGKEGFHVVYGPNEAGKSSALRALHHLLYGIPMQSADDFIHSYTKMRLGAVIEAGNGDRLDFMRRKGRSNTLRANDDRTIIEDARLHRYLAGVDAALFETMFGIGYEDLVHGGREIVRGGGRLGQIIFSAGSGIANLRKIQDDLQSEADMLFKPSGSKPKINATIDLIKKSRKEMQETMLPGREWHQHDQALREAIKRLTAVEGELADKNRNLHHLERVRDALPLIARRTELLDAHAEYASVALLPEEFPEKRRKLVTDLGVWQSSRDQASKSIHAAQSALENLEVSNAILDKAELIEALYRELGSQYKASRDRIKLETRMSSLRGEAREILRELRDDLTVEDAEKLRLKKPQAVRIRDLGAEYERISTRIDAAGEAIPALERRIADLDDQLNTIREPGPIEALQDAVLLAEEYLAAEKQCRSEQLEIETANKTLNVKLAAQAIWSGSLADLESLALPSLETISRFEESTVEADHNFARCKREVERLEESLADFERRIEELRLQQEVPSEEGLRRARDLRDRGWRLVVGRLVGQEPADDQIERFLSELQFVGNLTEAFQASLLQADEIADRLRREADRVGARARLFADRTACKSQLDRIKEEFREAQRAREELAGEWQALWQPLGIVPRSPKEMQSWSRNLLALTEKAAGIREKNTRMAASQQQVDKHVEILGKCLHPICETLYVGGKTLADLIPKARRIITREEELRRRTEGLKNEKAAREQELAGTKLRVASGHTELDRWREQWEDAVRPLGLDSAAFPSQANAVMDELRDLFDRLKEADILQKRIAGIDRDAGQYAEMVGGLIATIAGDLAGLPAAEAAGELNARLTRARTAQTKKQTLEGQFEKDRVLLGRANHRIAEVETALKAMADEAGCENHEQLPEAERRSDRRRRMEDELRNINERLRQLSGGATIEGFIAEALKVDPDGIAGQAVRLEEAIGKLNREKSELNQTIGREESELGKMDGSGRAAAMAEDIQLLLGRLEGDVEQYCRLKVAARVLNMAIERYRDKNQGPLLIRATELFRQLTRGSFEGVRAEFDPQSQPLLVGMRPGGKETVAVDGMSDGTADQLYLALRLAGLEDYLARNEAMPFIVDDILIKFDDQRAAAALQVLAELSKKTQVIFFTHHRHLVDLAEKHIDASVLIRHELGG